MDHNEKDNNEQDDNKHDYCDERNNQPKLFQKSKSTLLQK